MAIDWLSSYGVTYEWWEVNPNTYRDVRKIADCIEGSITRDASDETLGTSSLTTLEPLGEKWVRTYLVVTQNNKTERVCLGTHVAIGQNRNIQGRMSSYPLDLYTPLKEVVDDGPPDGYAAKSGDDAIGAALAALRRFHVKVRDCSIQATLPKQIVALNDSWLSFAKKILEAVNAEVLVDEYGYAYLSPVRSASALAPVWTFVDDSSSIMDGDATLTYGWSEVPNTVKVVLSDTDSTVTKSATNDSSDSPASTVSRGRIVSVTEENPEGISTPKQAEDYARRRLKELSNTERKITFKHGYCPVRLGDCIRIRKTANDLDLRAKVVRQTITCQTDLMVETEAVFTEEVWND